MGCFAHTFKKTLQKRYGEVVSLDLLQALQSMTQAHLSFSQPLILRSPYGQSPAPV